MGLAQIWAYRKLIPSQVILGYNSINFLNLTCYTFGVFIAVVYGNGVYFARNANYSSRPTYSPPDANGYKYVYYARVLTGEYTTGRQGLFVPPSKDPTNQTVLYDSVVDNVQNPSVYVTFYDPSNYPEYLIVFN